MHVLPRRMTRRAAVVAALLLVTLLAACGADVSESLAPPPTASPSLGVADVPGTPAERAAYSAAICPLFDDIVVVDPRLAALREAGAGGGDVTAQAAELASVGDELLRVLNGLEEVPSWEPGNQLRFQVITALHDIRVRVLAVAADPASATAAEQLATLPFIATERMDRAMSLAVQAGFACLPAE